MHFVPSRCAGGDGSRFWQQEGPDDIESTDALKDPIDD
jgi:hypothetical protein